MYRRTTALIVLISVSAALSQEWSRPKFLPPDSTMPGKLKLDLNGDTLSVEILEEANQPLRIAKINYQGDKSPSVQIYPQSEDSGWNQLGAVLEKFNSAWHVLLINKANYGKLSPQKATIIVSIGDDSGIIQLEAESVKEDAPLITMSSVFLAVLGAILLYMLYFLLGILITLLFLYGFYRVIMGQVVSKLKQS